MIIKMRPRRIYKEGNRFFYIINGKRRYIKIKEDVTEKQIVRANLKRIEKPDQAKRVKPLVERKPTLPYRFEQPIVNGDIGRAIATSYYNPQIRTASSGFVEQGKKIISIEDIITGAERKKKEKFGENIVDFFSALASKKNELFANITINQSPGTLTKPVVADATKDNIETSGNSNIPETNYENAIRDVLLNEDEFKNVWSNSNKQLGNIYNRLPPNYNTFLNYILSSFGLEKKDDLYIKLFRKFKTGTDLGNSLEGQYYATHLNIVQEEEENKSESKEEGVLQESKGEEPTLSGDTKPSKSSLPPIEPTRPKYQKPGGKKPFLKAREGTLASSGVKPLTTEEKLATTPSYSGTPQGTEAPAEPLRDVPTSSPMVVSYVEQLRKEMGFGEYESSNGLYNDEIAKIIRKRVGKVIPVVPSDKVNDLLSYVVKGDKKFAAVINTNPSQSDGSGNDSYRPGHWRAIFIDCRDDFPSCEYFDPLAEGKPEKSLVDVMKKICKKMNPEKLCLLKQNNIRRQAKEKSTCGWHVLQFIDDRWKGVPWSEASGYDNYMEKLKEPVDDSKDGEKEVEKYIKKYEVYI
jgi:hypothetical protein